jgi:hypothetical protein
MAYGTGELGQERVGALLRAQARHAHVAGVDGRLLGQLVDQTADRVEQRRPVAARQVRSADRALEEHVAGEDHLLVRNRERHMPWRVPGREDHVDVEARHLELLATLERVLGVPRLERAEARPGDVVHDVRQDVLLEHRDPDLGAGRLGHGSNGADVVEVRVGQQDGVEPDAQPVDRRKQLLGFVARVDDQSAVGLLAAEQVAVLRDRADGEHTNVNGHALRLPASGLLLTLPPVVEESVGVEAHREVEQHHERGEHET